MYNHCEYVFFIGLICYHGKADAIFLKSKKVENNSNVVLAADSTLMPMANYYSFSMSTFVKASNKIMDHFKQFLDKSINNYSTKVQLMHENTLAQIPNLNDAKRVIRNPNTALLAQTNSTKSLHIYNHTMVTNSTGINITYTIELSDVSFISKFYNV